MTGAMKMAMMRRNSSGSRNAYGGGTTNAYGGMDDARGNYGPENRRDSRGRYAPRNEGMNNAYGAYNEGGSMRMGSDKGWIVKPAEDRMGGAEMDPESRFRDRRGRQHYDNGRFAPMRNAYDGGAMAGGYDMGGQMPPVYNPGNEYRDNGSGGRMIGFYGGEMEGNYRMGAANGSRDELAQYRSQKHGGAGGSGPKNMDRQQAQEWVKKMKNADGSTGEHWTYEQTHQVMKQRNIDCEPAEFYATMNMLWSDYGAVAKKYGVDNVEFWAELSKSFLMDKDAEDHKLMLYYECIASK